ncbi:hypothetical protein FRC16_007112 [Serendipita sp. 398]|nr:hypothetical protein FRC16_007112 [Serendipita sp. 398]
MKDILTNNSRCGNELAPGEAAAIEERIRLDLSNSNENATEFDTNRQVVIKVVWHVIYTSETTEGGYVSPGGISASILALNYHYRGAGFLFSLDKITRTQNDDWFLNAKSGTSAESQMKNTLVEGDKAVLNLYSVGFTGGLLGYATFPWDVYTNPKRDGVVFSHTTVPGGSEPNYNQGKTLSHEVGHWLGLFHVFETGSCTGKGDYVDDTPLQQTPTSGCPESKSSCTNNGGDSIHNYMDYSYDRCMSEFTNGQKERARQHAGFYRGLR